MYLIVQILGFCYMKNLIPDKIRPDILIPITVSFITYILTVTMGYAQTSSCDKPKRDTIFIQSLKPALSVVIGFFLGFYVLILRQGFNDLLGEEKENSIAYWAAIGFWVSSMIWPSVTSAYFSIENKSCNNDSEIKIEDVPETVKVDQVI